MWKPWTNWREQRELKKLERELTVTPSESALRAVISCCQEHNLPRRALAAVQLCREQLPQSNTLDEWERLCKRWLAEEACVLAESRLREDPHPEDYHHFAEACLALHDMPPVYDALERCQEEFPDDPIAPRMLAEVLLPRFRRDLFVRDGMRIHELLLHSLELDPTSGATLRRLSEFLADVGLYASARQRAKQAMDLDRKDKEARSMYVGLGAVTKGDADPSLEQALDTIEQRGRLPGSGDDLESMRAELRQARHGLPDLEYRTRALRTGVLDADGHAWDREGELGSDPFVVISRTLADTALRTVRETGFGPLLGVSLEAECGMLILRKGRRTVTSALLPADAELQTARNEIDAFTTNVDAETAPSPEGA